MAIRLRLGSYEPVQGDPLGRTSIGYFPRMTEEEAWKAGRGVWKMNAERVARQRFALIVAEGFVRAAAEVSGHTRHEDRLSLDGAVLEPGHPIHAYVGKPDPVETGSQNPVGYVDLAEEAQFLLRPCGCGCGAMTDRDFLPGHDVRAMQDRVRAWFGASPRRFIDWVDTKLTEDAHAGGTGRWPGVLMPEVFHPNGVPDADARPHLPVRAPVAPKTPAVTGTVPAAGAVPDRPAEQDWCVRARVRLRREAHTGGSGTPRHAHAGDELVMVMRGRAGQDVVLDVWETEEPVLEALICDSDQLQVLGVLEEVSPWPGCEVQLVTERMRAAQDPRDA